MVQSRPSVPLRTSWLKNLESSNFSPSRKYPARPSRSAWRLSRIARFSAWAMSLPLAAWISHVILPVQRLAMLEFERSLNIVCFLPHTLSSEQRGLSPSTQVCELDILSISDMERMFFWMIFWFCPNSSVSSVNLKEIDSRWGEYSFQCLKEKDTAHGPVSSIWNSRTVHLRIWLSGKHGPSSLVSSVGVILRACLSFEGYFLPNRGARHLSFDGF
jgi:hypothetical protein